MYLRRNEDEVYLLPLLHVQTAVVVEGIGRTGGCIGNLMRVFQDKFVCRQSLIGLGIIRNIDDWQSITSPELLAKYLNAAGVTPPNVKDN